MKHVGKAWAKLDPASGLQLARSMSPQAGNPLSRQLIEQWAQRDLAAASKIHSRAAGLAIPGALGAGLVASWGKSDPAARARVEQRESARGSASGGN
jgi:hypothetical protein